MTPVQPAENPGRRGNEQISPDPHPPETPCLKPYRGPGIPPGDMPAVVDHPSLRSGYLAGYVHALPGWHNPVVMTGTTGHRHRPIARVFGIIDGISPFRTLVSVPFNRPMVTLLQQDFQFFDTAGYLGLDLLPFADQVFQFREVPGRLIFSRRGFFRGLLLFFRGG